MPPLPVLSGREVVRVYKTFGWKVARQRGSHIIMVKADHVVPLSVPDHKEIAKGPLRSPIRAAGLTAEAFAAEAEKR